MTSTHPVMVVAGRVGGFYEMSLSTFRSMVTQPVHWKEVVQQCWIIATVSLLPTLLMSVPFCVIVVFQINQLLGELGAGDLSGAGTGLAVIREIGPMVSVLVVAGAGATALCADLGARTIREELDALRVMGIHPVHRLIVPRVIASALVSVALNGLVSLVGLTGSFFFSVYAQHASPGLFIANLTLLTSVADFGVSCLKALVFGTLAGLVACYLGSNVRGGPKGVGDAVNQTVVFSFMLLFLANSVITVIYLQVR